MLVLLNPRRHQDCCHFPDIHEILFIGNCFTQLAYCQCIRLRFCIFFDIGKYTVFSHVLSPFVFLPFGFDFAFLSAGLVFSYIPAQHSAASHKTYGRSERKPTVLQ